VRERAVPLQDLFGALSGAICTGFLQHQGEHFLSAKASWKGPRQSLEYAESSTWCDGRPLPPRPEGGEALPKPRGLSFLTQAIFKDHLVDDVATENTSPPEKFFATAGELFEDHDPSTTFALHFSIPPFWVSHSVFSFPLVGRERIWGLPSRLRWKQVACQLVSRLFSFRCRSQRRKGPVRELPIPLRPSFHIGPLKDTRTSGRQMWSGSSGAFFSSKERPFRPHDELAETEFVI